MEYNFDDNFELLYLRHDYINRCENLNPEYIKEFKGIIDTTSKIMYDKLWVNFKIVGLDVEDIASVASVYTMIYMELYSIRNSDKYRQRFIKKYVNSHGKMPSDARIKNADKNSLINFLRQKIQHTYTLCTRKARNITVDAFSHGYYAYTKDSIKSSPEAILKDYKKLKYRKSTKAEYESGLSQDGKVSTDKDGYEIMYIHFLPEGLGAYDYNLIRNSTINPYNSNPETCMEKTENQYRLDIFKDDFNGLPERQKKIILKNFIRNNRGSKHLREELQAARKIVKNFNENHGIIG